jgi:Calx-beta domain
VVRLLVPLLTLLAVAGGARAQSSPPALSIDDVRTIETNVDTVAVSTVTLAAASPETVTVRYATVAGTADSTDYVPDAGTLTFPPGTTTVRVPVMIKGDALDEPDETFSVELAEAEHATIARARGVVTIVDSDTPRVFPVDAAVRASWNVHRAYTTVKRLLVARAPAGASIEAHCRGQGCPFAARQTDREATALFRNAKLRAGATVQLWVDAPGTIGKAFVYTIRSGKRPRARILCLPAVATKPSPC